MRLTVKMSLLAVVISLTDDPVGSGLDIDFETSEHAHIIGRYFRQLVAVRPSSR